MAGISGRTKVCMIIGDPVSGSLSPLMHNHGYKILGIDYVYVAARVLPSSLQGAIDGIRSLEIRGASCTMPHKEGVIPLLDEVDEKASIIGAVNTIVNEDGRLTGYNTDWLGIVTPLENHRELQQEKVLILGTGGASKAAAYGVTARGAKLTVMGRNREAARVLAEQYGGDYCDFSDLEVVRECSIVINATPVGMTPDLESSPLPATLITPRHLIFDTVYSPLHTRLLKDAQAAGATVIIGTEMLLHQGVAQFELFTGRDAPVEEMREILQKTVRGEL